MLDPRHAFDHDNLISNQTPECYWVQRKNALIALDNYTSLTHIGIAERFERGQLLHQIPPGHTFLYYNTGTTKEPKKCRNKQKDVRGATLGARCQTPASW